MTNDVQLDRKATTIILDLIAAGAPDNDLDGALVCLVGSPSVKRAPVAIVATVPTTPAPVAAVPTPKPRTSWLRRILGGLK